jgi:hypothetical protein
MRDVVRMRTNQQASENRWHAALINLSATRTCVFPSQTLPPSNSHPANHLRRPPPDCQFDVTRSAQLPTNPPSDETPRKRPKTPVFQGPNVARANSLRHFAFLGPIAIRPSLYQPKRLVYRLFLGHGPILQRRAAPPKAASNGPIGVPRTRYPTIDRKRMEALEVVSVDR